MRETGPEGHYTVLYLPPHIGTAWWARHKSTTTASNYDYFARRYWLLESVRLPVVVADDESLLWLLLSPADVSAALPPAVLGWARITSRWPPADTRWAAAADDDDDDDDDVPAVLTGIPSNCCLLVTHIYQPPHQCQHHRCTRNIL